MHASRPKRNVVYNNEKPANSGKRRVKRNSKSNSMRRLNWGSIIDQGFSDMRKYLFNTEDKYVDSTGNSTAVSTTASFVLLNGLAQGNAQGQRIGDSVNAINLEFNFLGSINASAVTSAFRLVLFFDRKPQGAIPTIATLFSANNTYSLYNPTYAKRYNIILDRLISFNSNGEQSVAMSGFLPLMQHTEFGLGDAGTIADIEENSLFLMLISDQGTNTVMFSYYIRYVYVDN